MIQLCRLPLPVVLERNLQAETERIRIREGEKGVRDSEKKQRKCTLSGLFPMIPLQVAYSGRPGTEPKSRNRTY